MWGQARIWVGKPAQNFWDKRTPAPEERGTLELVLVLAKALSPNWNARLHVGTDNPPSPQEEY